MRSAVDHEEALAIAREAHRQVKLARSVALLSNGAQPSPIWRHHDELVVGRVGHDQRAVWQRRKAGDGAPLTERTLQAEDPPLGSLGLDSCEPGVGHIGGRRPVPHAEQAQHLRERIRRQRCLHRCLPKVLRAVKDFKVLSLPPPPSVPRQYCGSYYSKQPGQ